MNFHSMAGFFCRYLDIAHQFHDDQQATYAMAQYIVIKQPELAPFVLQVLSEGE